MNFRKVKEVNLAGRRVIIREDLNVPLDKGIITSDARIKAALPTIQYALDKNAAVILISHLGRPVEGRVDSNLSLKPVAKSLEKLLSKPVRFLSEWIEGISINPGEIVLCENVRFLEGEKNNNLTLAKKMASLGDVFVMDAFATAHRAEASTVGITQFIPEACAGLLLAAELEALGKIMANPASPVLAIVGGSKVSSKLTVLLSLLHTVNQLILGGGIANTFLLAKGYSVGKSLIEKELLPQAKELLKVAEQLGVTILLPIDVRVAVAFSEKAESVVKSVKNVQSDEMILDIGPETAQRYNELIQKAATILWNGPVGVFEFKNFEEGTRQLAYSIAQSTAFSVAGGGDTLAAIEKYNLGKEISYISTGGGAFLEFIEGKILPAVAALNHRV